MDRPNVASLLFKTNEGSFLTGVVAGMLTETGKVGFVGGMYIPSVMDYFVGYQAGVLWANSSATVLEPFFVGDWNYPSKGKDVAQALIELGADAIFVVARNSGLGALEAVHENGIMGFGSDTCQDCLYSEIIASMTKRVDNAVFDIVECAVISERSPNLNEGGFEGGIYNKGVADEWTGCSRLPEEEPFWETIFDFVETPLPSDVLVKLTEARDQIVSGTITVPSAYT